MDLSPISFISSSFAVLLFLLALTPFLRLNQRLLITIGFSLTTIASLLATVAGIWAVSSGVSYQVIVPLGLPDLPFHLRLDPLSGFFLWSSDCSLFLFPSTPSDMSRGTWGIRSMTSLVVFYALFLAGMFLVVLADDAFFFLIAWEMMAAASYFLVLFEDEQGRKQEGRVSLPGRRPCGRDRHPPLLRGHGGACNGVLGISRIHLRCHARDRPSRRLGNG